MIELYGNNKIKEYLQSLSEKKLQVEIIIPLLNARGFKNVRDKSGASDGGQDLIAIYETPTREILYAVQIKKQKFNARHASSSSLQNLAVQLNQAEKKKVPLLQGGEYKAPDELIFITPFDFPQQAFELVQDNFLDSIKNNWSIIDGTMLVAQIIKFIPQTLKLLLSKEQRVKQLIISDLIEESAAAFNLKKPLNLDEIYVEVSVMNKMQEIFEVMNINIRKYQEVNLISSKSNLNQMCRLLDVLDISYSDFFYELPFDFKVKADNETVYGAQIISLDKELKRRQYLKYIGDSVVEDKDRIDKDKKRGKYKATSYSEHVVVTFKLKELLKDLKNKCQKYLGEVSKELGKEVASADIVLKYLVKLQILGEQYSRFKTANFSKGIFKVHLLDKNYVFPRIDPATLSKINHALFIVGPPGVGKTTLMRRLTGLCALENHAAPPIFFQLSNLAEPNVDSLLRQIAESGQQSEEEYRRDILSGEYSLFLDGLDELGPEAKPFLDDFTNTFMNSKVNVTISCRNTIGISWEKAISVEVPRFNDEQVKSFINNWRFRNEYDSSELLQKLSGSKNLSEIVRTPLFTALMCSIYSCGKEMPETEIELYDSRLNLLLGGWERSKGSVRTALKNERIIYNFICRFAADLHKERLQTFTLNGLKMQMEAYFKSEEVEFLITELISRSLIQKHVDEDYWFGHLTFQEHLVAKYYYENTDYDEIIENLSNRFYFKVWDMYSEMVPSLDPLFKYITKHEVHVNSEAKAKLALMVSKNSLTSLFIANRVLKLDMFNT